MTGKPNDQPVMCLFGSYAPKAGDALYDLAYRIGHGLASAGFVVCNGGYDGTMEASAKGAKDAGGRTIGVTCSIFTKFRGKPLAANPYIDHEIAHDNVFNRIREMLQLGVGYVMLEGGTGTLSEFGIVWEFVAKRLITPRPIFVVGDFWKPMVDRILSVRPKHGKHIHFVHTPDEIVEIAAGKLAGA